MKRCLKNALVFAAAMAGMWCAASVCFAHHLWVQEGDDTYGVCRGIIGDRLDPYDPSCIKHISAKAPDGTELSVNRLNEKDRIVFTTNEKPALVAVVSEWGDRVNTTRGKKLMNRQAAETAGLTVVSAFVSTQFSKNLFAPSAGNSQPLGLKFELVPLTDPMTLAPGTPAAFKVLFDGRPLEGISVFDDLDRESKTDENGIAEIAFEKGGMHLLYAAHRIPAEQNSGLDYLKFMTFLTFEVN
ncbi:MAG: DUF4198 domain-containing protein [Desulfobacterales bacterium]